MLYDFIIWGCIFIVLIIMGFKFNAGRVQKEWDEKFSLGWKIVISEMDFHLEFTEFY